MWMVSSLFSTNTASRKAGSGHRWWTHRSPGHRASEAKRARCHRSSAPANCSTPQPCSGCTRVGRRTIWSGSPHRSTRRSSRAFCWPRIAKRFLDSPPRPSPARTTSEWRGFERQIEQGPGHAEQKVERDKDHAHEDQRACAAALHPPDSRPELVALELRRDQREVEIRHFGAGCRCTRQHLPEPIWRGCDAHACEAPTEASRLPATNDLAADPQPLGKLPTFVPPGGRRGHHTAKFSQRSSNIGGTRRMCPKKSEFGRFLASPHDLRSALHEAPKDRSARN